MRTPNTIRNLLTPTLRIDKLFQEKLAEFHLVEELPHIVIIGSRILYVGSFGLEIYYTFIKEYSRILIRLNATTSDFSLLADSTELYKHLMLNRRIYRRFQRLIARTVLKQQSFYRTLEPDAARLIYKKCTARYFTRHITVEKMLQICKLVYYYNHELVKRNLSILAEKMGVVPQAETYMYNWLQNLGGLSGEFVLKQIEKEGMRGPATVTQRDGQQRRTATTAAPNASAVESR